MSKTTATKTRTTLRFDITEAAMEQAMQLDPADQAAFDKACDKMSNGSVEGFLRKADKVVGAHSFGEIRRLRAGDRVRILVAFDVDTATVLGVGLRKAA
jgi:mRNA-degrading endonuclease RelE of RelBE toxin-antitoxin system